jgi:hypothetical protein
MLDTVIHEQNPLVEVECLRPFGLKLPKAIREHLADLLEILKARLVA